MERQRGRVLLAAVLLVWSLLVASYFCRKPLFLTKPPITRRQAMFQFTGEGCSFALTQGTWTDVFQTVSCTNATQQQYGTCADAPQRQWQFAPAAQACNARRFSAAEAQELLAGQRLVFAGDSIARHLYGAALRLLGQPGQEVVVGHQDFHHELSCGISLQFLWAPYPANLTTLLRGNLQPGLLQQLEQQQQNGTVVAGGQQRNSSAAANVIGNSTVEGGQQQEQQEPALVLMSATLWHLLHFTEPADYRHKLQQLKEAAAAYSSNVSSFSNTTSSSGGRNASGGMAGSREGLRMVLTSGTDTFPNRMPTELKRQHMTPSNLDQYNKVLAEVQLLAPAGPFSLLNLFPLTHHCGEECSTDGVHSQPVVYDVAMQLLLNLVAAPAEKQAEQQQQGSGKGKPVQQEQQPQGNKDKQQQEKKTNGTV